MEVFVLVTRSRSVGSGTQQVGVEWGQPVHRTVCVPCGTDHPVLTALLVSTRLPWTGNGGSFYTLLFLSGGMLSMAESLNTVLTEMGH